MIAVLGDPRVADALIAIVVAGIGALGALGAFIIRQMHAYMEVKFSHILADVEETRSAAQSADEQVKNNHDTNIRDDIDKAIETVGVVSDQVGALAAQVSSLADQVAHIEATLEDHGKNLDTVKVRVDRLGEELHDERTAREAAQRILDEHSHDAHARLHERLDKLEVKQEKCPRR